MSRNRYVPIATALIVDDDFDDMMSFNKNNDQNDNNNNHSDDQICIAPTTRDSFTSSFYNYNYDSDDNCNDNSCSKKMFATKTNSRNIKSVSSQKYLDNNSNNYNHQLIDSTLFRGTTTSEPVTKSSKSMSLKLKRSPSQHSSTPKYSSTPTTSTKIFTEVSTCPYPQTIFNYHNEENAREYLSEHRVPNGIQDHFIRTLKEIPMRYFILDDSGSMSIDDGKRIINDSLGRKRIIKCSRWNELVEAMKFHINFAKAAVAPTEFRMINMSTVYPIGFGNNQEDNENYDKLMTVLNRSVSGKTPLCKHIHEVALSISKMKKELKRKGQKVCVMIATDGEPTDGNLTQSMKLLIDLPVWIVIRLCTNEPGIVDYWSRIDDELELNIDVIDDYTGEAIGIKKFNSWLRYGESLHRLREFGCLVPELDHIDQGRLSAQEFIKICHLIFGGELSDYPHPDEDFQALLTILNNCNENAGKIWDPVTRSEQYWINIRKVLSKYGHQRRCIFM